MGPVQSRPMPTTAVYRVKSLDTTRQVQLSTSWIALASDQQNWILRTISLKWLSLSSSTRIEQPPSGHGATESWICNTWKWLGDVTPLSSRLQVELW